MRTGLCARASVHGPLCTGLCACTSERPSRNGLIPTALLTPPKVRRGRKVGERGSIGLIPTALLASPKLRRGRKVGERESLGQIRKALLTPPKLRRGRKVGERGSVGRIPKALLTGVIVRRGRKVARLAREGLRPKPGSSPRRGHLATGSQGGCMGRAGQTQGPALDAALVQRGRKVVAARDAGQNQGPALDARMLHPGRKLGSTPAGAEDETGSQACYILMLRRDPNLCREGT
ncbi:hypothetical protein CALVIDRAFT_530414 [Calocera viscosa TUFC12733]|uniref:Uncharacterized protein n=1 Tax=Calocera viscosa (strain TUFC12733) TaxID=1330018 RepID=A0A167HZ93_CALVF|nr:hypothetical protein CALVIDRAFT_530414 [Calocera viscosa TUFC12733]